MESLQKILNDLPSINNHTTDAAQQLAHAKTCKGGESAHATHQLVEQPRSNDRESPKEVTADADTAVRPLPSSLSSETNIFTCLQVEDDEKTNTSSDITTVSERKPLLINCPDEILLKIINELDPVSSACFSLTARKVYGIRQEVHGKVKLHDHCEKVELCQLINTFMEEGGYRYLVKCQDFKGRWNHKRWFHAKYYPGVFVKATWLESLKDEGRD